MLAGAGDNKVAAMQAHYESLDLLGINIYRGAEQVDGLLEAQGWDRPYLSTKFGPDGHWELPATSWGAPLEPTAAEKAEAYFDNHFVAMSAPRNLCLGTFCLFWGQTQETTATWFSMFLPTGERTPSIDVIVRAWSGAEPANPSPIIHHLEADFREAKVTAGSEHTVVARVKPTTPTPSSLSG